jgi:hypothetical protein
MNRPRASDEFLRFLEADALGREAEAERALAALLAALPAPGPAAGFAGRVLERVAALAPPRPALFARRPVRWALAATLLVAALGAGLVAPMVPPLARLVGPARIVGWAVEAVIDLTVRFAAAVAFWERLGEIGGTLARAAAYPTVAGLLLFHLLLAAGALGGLAALASKGNPRHVVS